MAEQRVLYTYADYLKLPDDEHYQIFNGVLLREPAARPYHQRVSGLLQVALTRFVEDAHLGVVLNAPIDVVLSPDNVLQPDILFVSRERLSIIGETHISEAPDLVVEILSPSTGRRDRTTKRDIYERFGVRELWIIDPDARTVDILDHDGRRFVPRGTLGPADTISSPQLPGLEIRVAGILTW